MADAIQVLRALTLKHEKPGFPAGVLLVAPGRSAPDRDGSGSDRIRFLFFCLADGQGSLLNTNVLMTKA